MFFLFFSMCAALIALWPSRKTSFYALLLMCATFPTSHAYSQIISFQGVYFYDAFVFFYVLKVLFESLSSRSFVVKSSGAPIPLFLFHLIVVVLVLPFIVVDKYYLKDLRPLFNMLFFICAFDLYSKARISLGDLLFHRLAALAALAAFAKFAIISSGLYAFQDEYYEVNAYRYIDSSAYFCAVYLIYVFLNNFKLSTFPLYRLVLPASTVFLANSRFVLLSLGLSVLVGTVKNVKSFLYGLFFVCFMGFLFIYLSFEFEIVRVLERFTVDGVYEQLIVRFSPALTRLSEFDFYNYFVGMGAGTFFEIPWFAYRGLEVNHSNIDSAYLTYFVKYGILGFVFLYGYLIAVIPVSKYSFYIKIFLASMFFVEAVQYQPFCIGLIASMILVRNR